MDKLEFTLKYEMLIHNKPSEVILTDMVRGLKKSNTILKCVVGVQLLTILTFIILKMT